MMGNLRHAMQSLAGPMSPRAKESKQPRPCSLRFSPMMTASGMGSSPALVGLMNHLSRGLAGSKYLGGGHCCSSAIRAVLSHQSRLCHECSLHCNAIAFSPMLLFWDAIVGLAAPV